MKNRTQNAAILYLKVKYAAMMIKGERHTIAKAEKPALTN